MVTDVHSKGVLACSSRAPHGYASGTNWVLDWYWKGTGMVLGWYSEGTGKPLDM